MWDNTATTVASLSVDHSSSVDPKNCSWNLFDVIETVSRL